MAPTALALDTRRGSQQSKDAATRSYLLRAGFGVSGSDENPLVQAMCKATQQSAVAQGWQREDARNILIKENADKEVKQHQQRFLDALQTYQDNAKEEYKTNVKLSLNNKHTWPEVMEAVENIQKARAGRTTVWAKVNEKLRAFGDSSLVFRQWLEILPTQNEYFSVLCGGFKLIFGAIGRLKAVREFISDALMELPTLLSCVDKNLDVFEDDQLYACGRSLMSMTFESLELIVRELTSSAVKKSFRAFLKQDTYADELEASLDRVRKTSDRFNKIADVCAHGKLGVIEENTVGMMTQLSLEHQRTNSVVAKEVRAAVQHLEGYQAERDRAMKQMAEQFYANMLSSFNSQLDKRLPLQERVPAPPMIKESRAPGRSSQYRRADVRAALLRELQYEPEVPVEDLATSLDAIWTADRTVHDRVHYLVAELQMSEWLSQLSRRILLIDETEVTMHRSIAPSFLAAKVGETAWASMRNGDNPDYAVIALAFFCGEHIRPNEDALASHAGLLLSITGQLVAAYEDLDPRKAFRELQALDDPDMASLWRIFEGLVLQLPDDVLLYVILDNVSEYVYSNWREEMEYLVDHMIELARQLSGMSTRCVLKLLITSSPSNARLESDLEPDEILSVPGHVPAVGEFSDYAWTGGL
ncbi:uncharacterized protein LTR77_007418 [Saxophila tyrrhenica]|uniref:Exocyst complex component Sec6 n=1 Tax=Saxophila tyrrhenica TaxID=1690608 RepID=A0AAV9P7L5_9PEZI|nr:hypothetical protein LTR77_007418 [Saxophila tyrrhenica]